MSASSSLSCAPSLEREVERAVHLELTQGCASEAAKAQARQVEACVESASASSLRATVSVICGCGRDGEAAALPRRSALAGVLTKCVRLLVLSLESGGGGFGAAATAAAPNKRARLAAVATSHASVYSASSLLQRAGGAGAGAAPRCPAGRRQRGATTTATPSRATESESDGDEESESLGDDDDEDERRDAENDDPQRQVEQPLGDFLGATLTRAVASSFASRAPFPPTELLTALREASLPPRVCAKIARAAFAALAERGADAGADEGAFEASVDAELPTAGYQLLLLCKRQRVLRREALVAVLRSRQRSGRSCSSWPALLVHFDYCLRQEHAYAADVLHLARASPATERLVWHTSYGASLLLSVASVRAHADQCKAAVCAYARRAAQDREMRARASVLGDEDAADAGRGDLSALREAIKLQPALEASAVALASALVDDDVGAAAAPNMYDAFFMGRRDAGGDSEETNAALAVRAVTSALPPCSPRLQQPPWRRLLRAVVAAYPDAFWEHGDAWARSVLRAALDPALLHCVRPLFAEGGGREGRRRGELLDATLISARKALFASGAASRIAGACCLVELVEASACVARKHDEGDDGGGIVSAMELRGFCRRILSFDAIEAKAAFYAAIADACVSDVAGDGACVRFRPMLREHLERTFLWPERETAQQGRVVRVGSHWVTDSLALLLAALGGRGGGERDGVVARVIAGLARLTLADFDIGDEADLSAAAANGNVDRAVACSLADALESAVGVCAVASAGDEAGGVVDGAPLDAEVLDALEQLRQSVVSRLGAPSGSGSSALRAYERLPSGPMGGGGGADKKSLPLSKRDSAAGGAASKSRILSAATSATATTRVVSGAASLAVRLPPCRALALLRCVSQHDATPAPVTAATRTSLARLALDACHAAMERAAPFAMRPSADAAATLMRAFMCARRLGDTALAARALGTVSALTSLASSDADWAALAHGMLGDEASGAAALPSVAARVADALQALCRSLAADRAWSACAAALRVLQQWLEPLGHRLRAADAMRALLFGEEEASEADAVTLPPKPEPQLVRAAAQLACGYDGAAVERFAMAVAARLQSSSEAEAGCVPPRSVDYAIARAAAECASASLDALEWNVQRGIAYLAASRNGRAGYGEEDGDDAEEETRAFHAASESFVEHARAIARLSAAPALRAKWHAVEPVARAQIRAFQVLVSLGRCALGAAPGAARRRMDSLRAAVHAASSELGPSAHELMAAVGDATSAEESRAKIGRESALFPKLVYEMERADKCMVTVSKRHDDWSLMREMRRGVARCFRIHAAEAGE